MTTDSKSLFLGFLSLALCLGASAQSSTFNVRDYAATGAGAQFDTAAIQKTINDCAAHGGGIVRFPAGVYLTKSIFLSNNITLQLDDGAVIKAAPNPDDWGDPAIALIHARGVTNVGLEGKGVVDGDGSLWWPPVLEAKRANRPYTRRRPRLVIFSGCRNVHVRGVTLRNSPMFHLVPMDCENVLIDNISILAPADSPNTDAIDPSVCHHVRISHCLIDVGDDNVAIKSAHPWRGGGMGCDDIVISDCTFLHGHGVSIGSETMGGVTNLLVERCSFKDTIHGIRIKTSRAKGGLIDGAVYRDLSMKDVRWPINIACYYPKLPAEDSAQPITATTPVYRNIHFVNLTATSPDSAGFIVGLPEKFISGISLQNVTIHAPRGLTVRNTDDLKLTHVNIKTETGEPLLTNNAHVEILIAP